MVHMHIHTHTHQRKSRWWKLYDSLCVYMCVVTHWLFSYISFIQKAKKLHLCNCELHQCEYFAVVKLYQKWIDCRTTQKYMRFPLSLCLCVCGCMCKCVSNKVYSRAGADFICLCSATQSQSLSISFLLIVYGCGCVFYTCICGFYSNNTTTFSAIHSKQNAFHLLQLCACSKICLIGLQCTSISLSYASMRIVQINVSSVIIREVQYPLKETKKI